MDDLLKYFIDETNKKLDRMEESLSDLQKFRVSLIAQSRLTAVIVSAVCGFVTLAVTVAVTLYVGK